MLKGAIIGFGQVAEKAHAPAWKARASDFEIVAAADASAERLKVAQELFPGIRCYGTPEELLRAEKGLDFVDIATPPFLHLQQILVSLEWRCHVLCEKPLVLVPQNFESIKAQAHAQKRLVYSVDNWKHAPLFAKAAQLVREGVVGTVQHVELHTLRTRPAIDAAGSTWRIDGRLSGGGILVDHGWHNFYLIQSLISETPRSISARLRFPRPEAVEEEAACFIEYQNSTAFIFLSWRSPRRSNWAVIHGSAGTIELRDDHILTFTSDGEDRIGFPQKISAGSAHPDWFASMLEDFKADIHSGVQRARNMKESEQCVTLLTSAYQSHRLGCKTIALPQAQPSFLSRRHG